MEALREDDAAERLGVLEVVTLIFSVYVLIALFIQATIKLSPDAVNILRWMDWLVCAIFLIDFFVRFHRAESKRQFVKWGWIDFISSLPVNIFQVGRVVRIIRVQDSSGFPLDEESSDLLSCVQKVYVIRCGRRQCAVRNGI
jgi:voltage-gated potassium channel